jgi:uncharacterized protein (DUF2267 family)
MSRLSTFDKTTAKSYEWLADVSDALGCEDTRSAYAALRATLHALRDHLTVEEGAQLAAQLPILLRGVFYESWKPSHSSDGSCDRTPFLLEVERELVDHPELTDVTDVVSSVFEVIADRVAEGEIEQVIHQLPREVRELWPSGAN